MCVPGNATADTARRFHRRCGHRAHSTFWFHTPFPTSEIFRTLSSRDELLQGILASDMVGFHVFNHARHFMTSCKRLLGLTFKSRQVGCQPALTLFRRAR